MARARKVYQHQVERQLAIALRYDEEKDEAPRVVAKGLGKLAEKILAIAREKNIPIKENEDLALLLTRLNLGEEIPPEVYPLVAEILSYVYLVSGKYREEREERSEKREAKSPAHGSTGSP